MVKDEEVLDQLRVLDRPFITASDVAGEHDVSNQTARRWLDGLVDDDRLNRHKVGGSAVVWWEEDYP